MAANPKEILPEYNFRSLAKSAMEQAGGNVQQASAILERMCHDDEAVWLAVTERVLKSACYDAVRYVCHEQRRAVWYSPNYSKGGNGHRAIAHARTLMDWPLPGGKLLRDATASDLMEAALFYRKQSDQMARIALWLEAVAEKTGKRKVENALSAEQLEELKGE